MGITRSFPTDLGGTGTIIFFTADLCLIHEKLISFIKCLGKYLIHVIGLIEIKTAKAVISLWLFV